MAKIESLASRHLSEERNLERIVAAAKAEPGIWLMVREREMELRAIQGELQRLGADVSEIDRLFPKRLTPLLTELASDLVSHMFGSCPAEMLEPVQEALLEAARHESEASRSG
jgi:alkylhydroperoxidase family enzyme